MYYMLFAHDYVLYMDKLYVSFHVMHLMPPIMENPENNQQNFYRVYNILLTIF